MRLILILSSLALAGSVDSLRNGFNLSAGPSVTQLAEPVATLKRGDKGLTTLTIRPGYAIVSRTGVITPINWDSLALVRYAEDSVMASRILQNAQIQADLLMGLARRNLQRDTAKAVR